MEYLLRCKTLWYVNEVLEPNAMPETMSLIVGSHKMKMDDKVVIKKEPEDDLTKKSKFAPPNIVKVEPEDHISTDTYFINDRKYAEIRSDETELDNQYPTNNDANTGGDKELYKCKDCDKSFTTKSGLWRHAKKHSTCEEFYSCMVCDKSFGRKYGLLKHMETHTNVKKVEVKCHLCDRPFDSQYNYNRHMKSHTVKDPDANKCEYCSKTFSNKANLKTHMKRHAGEEKSTATTSMLGGDETTQNIPNDDEKMFACDGCDKTFKSKHYLKEHARIHLAKNPYQCMLCEKQLSCKANLMVHMRTHVRKGTTGTELNSEALIDLL